MIIIVLIFSFTSSYAQKVDSDSLIGAIRKDVTVFFLKKEILNKNLVKENLDYVLINEINKKRIIGFDKIGIYSISVFQSHSEKHILIKENSSYKILDIQDIEFVIKEVMDFSSRYKFTKNEMLSYLKKIIQFYDGNYNQEYTSIGKE